MKVLIADDHLHSTRFLAEIVQESWPEAEVISVHTIEDALEQLPEGPWALAISDLGFEGKKDYRFIRAAADLDIPVYVYTDFVNPFTLGEAARAGARAYLAKSAIDLHLRSAIANLFSPDRIAFACPITTRRIGAQTPAETPHLDLDPRERPIVEAGSRGLTPQEIAAETGLSYNTVRGYIRDVVHRNNLKIDKIYEYFRLLTRSD